MSEREKIIRRRPRSPNDEEENFIDHKILVPMVGLIRFPNFYEGDLLSGLWTLWVSGVEGYKGFCEVHGFKGLMNRRSQQFKGLRVPRSKG